MAASLALEASALRKIVETLEGFDRRLKDAKEFLSLADDLEVRRWLTQEVTILSLQMRMLEAICR